MVFIVFSMLIMMFPMGNVNAITGNPQPDTAHPYVVLVVVDVEDANGNNVPAWRGTGALISSTVVLTAAHLTDGAVSARIFLGPGPFTYHLAAPGYPYGGDTIQGKSIEGKPYTNPDYANYLKGNAKGVPYFETRDVGIVVLDKAVSTSDVSSYGQLPLAGYDDQLSVGTGIDFVGFGVQYQVTPKNMGPYNAWTGVKERFTAPANLLSGNFAWSDEFLRVSANAAQGKGGTAFGDSGGPVLRGGTNTILAVVSYGTNSNCAGVGYYQRVDIPAVLDWINDFLV